MRDRGLQHEVMRYDADARDDEDSPAVMWAIAIGAPLFLIGCIYAAHWMFLA